MDDNDWRFKGFRGSTTQAYDQRLAIPPRDPRQLAPQPTSAVNRMSPSGTDWNATFGMNRVASPSGTDWAKTFGSPFLSPKSAPTSTFNFTLGGDLSDQLKLGSTTSTTNGAGRIAANGDELDLPNDPFRKFFGGGIPTPTPTPSPSPKYMASSPVIPPDYRPPNTSKEEQLYGWGSGYA